MTIFQSDGDSAEESTEPYVSHTGRLTISRKLRELYDSVQDEGIPDQLLDLLEKLDQVENQAKKAQK